MTALNGIIPPLPTPFTQDGDFAKALQTELIKTLEPEVDGFLILGSNGEAAYLKEGERTHVLENARASIPEMKPMIAGTGGEATSIVIERNQVAKDIGADYVLVVPPFYFKGSMTDAVLERHYLTIADKSPLPVLLYNIPAATTLSLSPSLVANLAKHSNIVGIKDSSGTIGALTEIMRQVPEDFVVFTGNAPTLLPALALGAKGGILAVANVVPEIYKQLKLSFDKGDIDTARRLQTETNPLALAVTSQYGVPGLKAVLKLQGRDAGYPRAPLLEVSDEVKEVLEKLFGRSSVNAI